MADETGEVSAIGVRLTLDATNFSSGMKTAQGELNAFQKQARTAGSGASQMKAGAGANTGPAASAAQSAGVSVNLSVNKAQLASLREQIIRGLGPIPITLAPQFATTGRYSVQNVMGSVLSLQYGVSQQAGARAATAAIEKALGSMPKKASGGPVSAGRPIIVGERQAEVFVPRTSGTVVPSLSTFGKMLAEQQWKTMERARGGDVYPASKVITAYLRRNQELTERAMASSRDERLAMVRSGEARSAQEILARAKLLDRAMVSESRESHYVDAAIKRAMAKLPRVMHEPGMGRRYFERQRIRESGPMFPAGRLVTPEEFTDLGAGGGRRLPPTVRLGGMHGTSMADFSNPLVVHGGKFYDTRHGGVMSEGGYNELGYGFSRNARGGPVHASRGRVARKGGLPPGFRLEFLSPVTGNAQVPWSAAGTLPDAMALINRPIRNDRGRMAGVMAVVRGPAGEIAGTYPFSYDAVQDALHPDMSFTAPGYRRRGLATAAYVRAERFSGKQIMPSETQLLHGKALWGMAGRPFGQRFGDRPLAMADQERLALTNQGLRAPGMDIHDSALPQSAPRQIVTSDGPLGTRLRQAALTRWRADRMGLLRAQGYSLREAADMITQTVSDFSPGGSEEGRTPPWMVGMVRHAQRGRLDVSGIEPNFRKYFGMATTEELAGGKEWYAKWGKELRDAAARLGRDPKVLTSVAAALSPNNGWPGNFYDAIRYAEAAAAGLPMPKASTFGANQRKAWQILIDDATHHLKGLKVNPFSEALLGDPNARPQDIWMKRAAVDDLMLPRGKGTPAPSQRREMDRVVDLIASEQGLEPRQVQAIIWTVARERGIAQAKLTKHARMRRRGGTVVNYDKAMPAGFRLQNPWRLPIRDIAERPRLARDFVGPPMAEVTPGFIFHQLGPEGLAGAAWRRAMSGETGGPSALQYLLSPYIHPSDEMVRGMHPIPSMPGTQEWGMVKDTAQRMTMERLSGGQYFAMPDIFEPKESVQWGRQPHRRLRRAARGVRAKQGVEAVYWEGRRYEKGQPGYEEARTAFDEWATASYEARHGPTPELTPAEERKRAAYQRRGLDFMGNQDIYSMAGAGSTTPEQQQLAYAGWEHRKAAIDRLERMQKRRATPDAVIVAAPEPPAETTAGPGKIPVEARRYRERGPGIDKSGTPRKGAYLQEDLRPWEPGDKGSWRWIKVPDPDQVIAYQTKQLAKAQKKGDPAAIAEAESALHEYRTVKARWAAGDLDYHPELVPATAGVPQARSVPQAEAPIVAEHQKVLERTRARKAAPDAVIVATPPSPPPIEEPPGFEKRVWRPGAVEPLAEPPKLFTAVRRRTRFQGNLPWDPRSMRAAGGNVRSTFANMAGAAGAPEGTAFLADLIGVGPLGAASQPSTGGRLRISHPGMETRFEAGWTPEPTRWQRYYQSHREDILAYRRAWNHAHKDEATERKRAWRAAHRDEYNAYMRALRARRRAAGGDASEGLYIVGELGPELFVPERLAHMVPKRVRDQIPGRQKGGIVEIGRTPYELFAPPEDGLIVPNHLKNQVPKAATGRDIPTEQDVASPGPVLRAQPPIYQGPPIVPPIQRRRDEEMATFALGLHRANAAVQAFATVLPRASSYLVTAPAQPAGLLGAPPQPAGLLSSGPLLQGGAFAMGPHGPMDWTQPGQSPERIAAVIGERMAAQRMPNAQIVARPAAAGPTAPAADDRLGGRVRVAPENEAYVAALRRENVDWAQIEQMGLATMEPVILDNRMTAEQARDERAARVELRHRRARARGEDVEEGLRQMGLDPAVFEAQQALIARQGQMAESRPGTTASRLGGMFFGGGREFRERQFQAARDRAVYTGAKREADAWATSVETAGITLEDVRKKLGDTNLTEEERAALAEKETFWLGEQSRRQETLTKARDLEAAAAEKFIKSAKAAEPTLLTTARNFAGNIAGMALWGSAMAAVGVGMAAAAPAAESFVDQLFSWQGLATKTTNAMGKAAHESRGNVDAVLAQAGANAGLSAGMLSFVEQATTSTALAKAAATAQQQSSDLYRTSLSSMRGNPPEGLYGGFGGVLGSALLGAQLGGGKGFTETIAGDLGRGAGGGPDIPNLMGKGLTYLTNESFRNFINSNAGSLPLNLGSRTPLSTLLPLGPQVQGTMDLLGGVGNLMAGRLPWTGPANPNGFLPGQGAPWQVAQAELTPAEREGQTAYMADLRGAAARGAEANGEQVKGTYELAKSQEEVNQAIKGAIAAGDDYGISLAQQGIVLKDATGAVITNGKAYEAAIEAMAKGKTIIEPEVWARENKRALQAQQAALGEQAQRQIKLEIPFEMTKGLLQQPLLTPGLSFFPGGSPRAAGMTGAAAGMAGSALRQSAQAGAELNKIAREGLDAARADIAQFTPDQLGAWDDAVKTAQALSGQIATLQSNMARLNQEASQASWTNQIRLARRALADAIALQGKAGGSRLGYLQREQYLIGRASQQLSLALQQRQITTQLALAQFQAPGETGEERYYRQRQAIAEAGVAQQQLNFSFREFTLSGRIWKETTDRAAYDAQMAIDVMQKARNAEGYAIAAQETIARKSAQLGSTLAGMDAMLARSRGNWSTALSAATTGVTQFAGSVKDAVNQIYKVMGIPNPYAQNRGARAGGYLGTVQGATQMTVGEAGTETVAVLRNPRMASLAPQSTGGGPTNISINFNGATVRTEADISRLARAVAIEVERSLSQKGQMFGLRGPAV